MTEENEIIWSKEDLRRNTKSGRTNIRVDGWPADVRSIALENLSLFGLDSNGEVYFDGKRLYTAKRFSNFERALAGITVAAALVAAVAACISAYADAATVFGVHESRSAD